MRFAQRVSRQEMKCKLKESAPSFTAMKVQKKKGKCLETENKKALSEAQKVDPLLLLLPFLFFLIQERETDFGESKKGLLPFSLSPFYRRGL